MRFLRVVLSRQIGEDVILSDGRIMNIEKVNNTTVVGIVDGKLVSVLHQTVSKLVNDYSLNAMLSRNIKSGLIGIEKPVYLDPKTNEIIKMPTIATKVSEKDELSKDSIELVEGDYILLDRDGDMIAVLFESYNKDKDINCRNKKGERFLVPKERLVSKIELLN